MTVPATTRRAGPFLGTGEIVQLPFAFKVFAQEDLVVTRAEDGAETVLTLGDDYTVTLNPDQEADPGGEVIPVVAPTTAQAIVLTSGVTAAQLTDLPSGGSYRAQVVEDALDRSVILVQQLQEQVERTLRVPVTVSADAELPVPEADKFIAWNSTADGLVNRDATDLASAVIAGTAYTNIFNGTGAQTVFTLTADPGSVNALDVFVSGVKKVNGVDFTVSGTTLTFTVAPASGTGNVVARYVAAVPAGTVDASAVNFTQAGTGGVAGDAADVLAKVLHVEQFGAVGNNIANDAPAILNAATRAVAIGATLLFDGAKTYRIDQSQLALPAGLRARTNGATFNLAFTTTSDTPALTIAGPCDIDEVYATVPTGVARERGISISGSDVTIGKVGLVSVDVQPFDDNNDYGVRVTTAARARIGLIRVVNYDLSVVLTSLSESDIGSLDVAGFVRGAYLLNNTDIRIGRSKIRTKSINASNTAGHVGVLLSCDTVGGQRNVTLDDWVIENAGEHGFRIGGPEVQANIVLKNPRARDCGNCGIKVLGTDTGLPTNGNTTIVIENPIIEDVGTSGSAAQKTLRLLLEYANFVQISNPIIRAKDNAVSAAYGILVNGCSDVVIDSPYVEDATNDGIYVFTKDGDLNRIVINGGISRANGRDGLRVQADATFTIRRITVNGLTLDGNSGLGFTVTGAGTILDSLLHVKTASNTGGAGACNSTAVTIDGYGTPGGTALSGITAANGSRWSDLTTLNYRKAGAWVAL